MTQAEFEDQAYRTGETPDPDVWGKLVEVGVDTDAHPAWAMREAAEELIRAGGGQRNGLPAEVDWVLETVGL